MADRERLAGLSECPAGPAGGGFALAWFRRARRPARSGRYETLRRPWFAPPGWVFPVAWGVNSALAIAGNVRVLNAPPSTDRTAYLRLWAATWLLYTSFGYAFFRRKSPLLGFLVTVNFLALSVLSARRALRIEARLWLSYATLLPWLALATLVAGSIALDNADPLLDPPA